MKLANVAWGDRGLVPVVAQDHLSGEIRMLAYANEEAVRHTVETGHATFFSRSRNALWRKGESSGNAMLATSVLVDCDADALVYLVAPRGPSCHTGAPSCFFREIEREHETTRPRPLLMRLESVLEARKAASAAASYTKSLYDGGPDRIGEKLREESGELATAITTESDERVVSEAADVVFHLMVALGARNVPFDAVLAELDRRFGTSGHDEKLSRNP
jgi:phosphoribosyl-ATP pyrophosphohydrolase/phosphoribosyl-AMP cyclohydrolase